jgi:hypothetical protein
MTLIRCPSQKPSCLNGVVWYGRSSRIHDAMSALRAGAIHVTDDFQLPADSIVEIGRQVAT